MRYWQQAAFLFCLSSSASDTFIDPFLLLTCFSVYHRRLSPAGAFPKFSSGGFLYGFPGRRLDGGRKGQARVLLPTLPLLATLSGAESLLWLQFLWDVAHQGSPFNGRPCPSPPLSLQPESGCGFLLLLLHHLYIQFPALNSFCCKYLETAGSFFSRFDPEG